MDVDIIEPSQSMPPVPPKFESTFEPDTESEPDDGNGCKERKRSFSDSDSVTTAPPIPKKTRIEMTSSVRSALESGTHHGILRFFTKATEEDHQAYLARSSEEIQQRMEEDEWKNNRIKEKKKMINRERERKKKREQRDRKKKREIIEGLRSPGGTKKTVRIS